MKLPALTVSPLLSAYRTYYLDTQSGNYKVSLQATNIHSITSDLYILSWVPTSPALLLWEAPHSSPSQGLPSLNREALIQWLKPLKSGCGGWKSGSSTLPAVVQARMVASLTVPPASADTK